MDHDPNPALRAEINAALDIIRPQIKGLIDFSKIVVSSSPVAAAVSAQIQARQHRQSLLGAVLTALDSVIMARSELADNDYPNLPNVESTPEVLAALHDEADAIAYALAIFEAKLLASTLSIRLGSASDKP